MRAARVVVPRETSKQKTREALISAAHELFAEHGLDGPSLDAICERAGYTRGAFYVHFRDREELLVAVMERVGRDFLSRIFEEVRSARTGARVGQVRSREAESASIAQAADRFIAAISAGAYPLMPSPTMATAQIPPHQLIEACARSPVVRERYRSLVEGSIEHVAALVALDQASGAVRPELDPRSVARVLLALVLGAQTMSELGIQADPAALARTVVAMLSTP
jgi:AcrR family transcriptional regulator